MSNEEKASSPNVRLLQLGTYMGDGEQKAIANQEELGFSFVLLLHYTVALMIVLLILLAAHGAVAVNIIDSTPSLLSWIANAINFGAILTILDVVRYAHYLKARVFLKASIQEAWYWQGNGKLRQQCVQPQDEVGFKELIQAANRLDRERALVYIAKEVWNHYDQLMIERDLKTDRLSKDWFMRQIAEDADPEGYVAQQE